MTTWNDLVERQPATYTAAYFDAGFVDLVRVWATVNAYAPEGDVAEPQLQIRWSNGYSDTDLMWTETDVSNANEGTGDGTTTTFTGSLAHTDIRAGTVSFNDGVETFVDQQDGVDSGVLVGDQGGSGTITYSTGAYSLTFDTAPVNGQILYASYTYADTNMYSGTDSTPMWQSWGPWTAWTVGEVEAELVQHRIVYYPEDGNPTIDSFRPVVDVPPQRQSGRSVSVPSTGVDITYTKQFHEVPVPKVTVVGSGLVPWVSNETVSGFTVELVDLSGAAAAGTIHWEASTE